MSPKGHRLSRDSGLYQSWLCQVQFQRAAFTFLPEPQAGFEAWARSISLRTDEVKIKDKTQGKGKLQVKAMREHVEVMRKEREMSQEGQRPQSSISMNGVVRGKKLHRKAWILLPCVHLPLWT